MRRGTTPTHKFTLPFDASELKEAIITYAQNDVIIFEKRLSDCETNGSEISVKLTQEETLKLDERKRMVQVQLKILTFDGTSLVSDIFVRQVFDVLNEEVMV